MRRYLSTHMSAQQAARTLDARQETGHHYTTFSDSAATISRANSGRHPEPRKERKGLASRIYQLLSGHAATGALSTAQRPPVVWVCGCYLLHLSCNM